MSVKMTIGTCLQRWDEHAALRDDDSSSGQEAAGDVLPEEKADGASSARSRRRMNG